MAVADILSGIGKGLATAGRAAVPVLERTAEVVSGEAPQIDEEQRQHKYKLEDEQINAKAQMLENNLTLGQKYGTLTPEQQQQYVDAISGLYSHPRHAGTLMEKLRKAIHPNGAYAQGPQAPLANAVPEGGTAKADQEAAERLAHARYEGARANNPRLVSLDSFTQAKFGTDFNASTPEQQEAALEAYGRSTRSKKMATKIIVDPDSPTGYSAATWDEESGAMLSKFPGVTPPRGFYPTERVSKSTDQFGNVTETVSETKPEIPGTASAQDQPQSSSGAKRVGAILDSASTGAKPVPKPAIRVVDTLLRKPAPLDANGHIPAGAANQQVVELANELLDGRDAKDIPMKGRAPAEALARQYGWEQGSFTPKEKILINEAGAKLQQLKDSPSLNVLDSTSSRLKIAQVLASGDKQSFMGRTASAFTAGQLTQQEQEFVRDYNAAVGVISGLAPLTRGGRPTEASIHRLMQEMPSVLQSANAGDAKARIDQLLQEIQVAAGTKGTTPIGSVGTGGKTITVKPEDLP